MCMMRYIYYIYMAAASTILYCIHMDLMTYMDGASYIIWTYGIGIVYTDNMIVKIVEGDLPNTCWWTGVNDSLAQYLFTIIFIEPMK